MPEEPKPEVQVNVNRSTETVVGKVCGDLNILQAPPNPPEGIPQNLPWTGAKLFVGRDEAMQTLHKQLQATERVAITSITGMGGIGKTELALQYAHYHLQQQTYRGGVCWLQARGVDLEIGIISFARSQLNLNPPEDYDLDVQVRYCWRNWPQGEVLVIFDDVTDYEEIEAFLPPAEPRFKVLITTRRQWLGQSFQRLELEVLEEAAALELLVSFVGEARIHGELEEAKALCEFLGFLPLGLELVGRYLQRKRDLSLAKTRQRLGLEHKSLELYSKDMTAQRGVAAAFELSWQELDEDARELGRLLSLFAPEAIPWSLVKPCVPGRLLLFSLALETFGGKMLKIFSRGIFSKILGMLKTPIEKGLRIFSRRIRSSIGYEKDWENVRDNGLVDLSLLQWVNEGSYQLHPLIREFFRGKLSESNWIEEMKRGVCLAIAAAAKKIPYQPTREDILAIEPAIPHIEEVAANLSDFLVDLVSVGPFTGLGNFYKGKGFYERAELWYEKCVEIVRTRLGSTHSYVATSLIYLASIYEEQGRYAEAEPLFLQALEIYKQQLGSKHPYVATSLNNLAHLYDSQGRYTEAEPLFSEALEMRKQLLGSAHPNIATSLSNLASLYRSQGRYSEAEPLCLEALEMRKQLLGSAHLDIATSLNNLANLYRFQGRYSEAEPLFIEALEMYKQLLESAHPYIATSLSNLAGLYRSQGRYSEAEPLFLEALEMEKQLLGSAHPSVAISLNNLALLYEAQKRYIEAEPLYLQALEMKKQLLGSAHPSVASSLNNLALLYEAQKRYMEAEPLYLQALEMNKQLLGSVHPDIANNLNNLAYLYEVQGRYSEAEPLFLQALAILIPQLEQEHPNTQKCQQWYRNFLQKVKSENRQGELSHEMSFQMMSQMDGDPGE